MNNKNIAQEYADRIYEVLASIVNKMYFDGDDLVTIEEYINDHDCGHYFIIDENGDYVGVRVIITTGGPQCVIDTLKGVIEVNWSTLYGERGIYYDIYNEINIIFREEWELIHYE